MVKNAAQTVPSALPAASDEQTASDEQAVGVACRLPRADGPDSFWQLLREGRSAVGEVPADRWGTDGRADGGALREVVRHGAYLDRVDTFDAAFFGISPREARAMDPQQRMMLELAWEAFEDAGVLPERVRGSRTGVFVGAIWDDYATLLARQGLTAVTEHSLTGLHRGIIANRISYTLGLHGPSLTVDTAQSSALVAVHLACESLRRGESELALAGGINLNIVPESTLGAAKFGGLSPDGRCFTFDARANGYVRGEGGGAVLLKPLAAALADGDPVLCVIRGSAVNNDGTTDGLTAPNAQAQRAVLRTAYARAGVDPAAVQYVELHGTGTRVGDPIEASAVGTVLGQAEGRSGPLVVGSAKTNVGHLEGAAGIVGLLKAALSLHHAELPASLNFETPNPAIPLDELNLRVQQALTPWPATEGPRLAGVSSFGMGGTNCHVVLEAAPQQPRPSRDATAEPALPVPWLLSGKSRKALRAQAARLLTHVESRPALRPDDVGLSLATARTAFTHRAVALGTDRGELVRALTALAHGEAATGIVEGRTTAGSDARTAFLFTGQGAQRPGMGRELHAAFPVFAAAFDEICAHFDFPLKDIVFASAEATGDGTDHAIHRTEFTQPALFAFEVALYRLVESFGVRPDFVAGHSIGEIAAAHVAGVLSLPDACRLVAARGRLMGALPAGGAMVSVQATEEEVRPLLGGSADIAAVNGPRSVVVSGAEDAVLEVAARLTELGRKTKRLTVSHAFHSPLMEPMLAEFAEVAASLAYTRPSIAMPPADGARDAEYWVRHVRNAVRFADDVRHLQEQGVGTFVEIGPGAVLTAMARETVTAEDARFVPALRKGLTEDRAALTALAELHTHGMPVDWETYFASLAAHHVPLPTYAFQRERYWIEETSDARTDAPVRSLTRPAPDHAEDDPDEPEERPGARYAALARQDEADALRALLGLVRSRAAAALGHASADELTPELPFKELGFDSYMSVELCAALQQDTGVSLPATSLYDHPSPETLARHLLDALRGTPAPVPRPAATAAPNRTGDDPVAVVAMACRYPGGISTPEQLWQLVADGGDAIGPFPTDRGWDLEALYDPDLGQAGRTYTRHGGFLYTAAEFDPAFFGISPREALAMDPQQRLLLETSWEALERAGIDPRSLRGALAGVFVGATAQDYGPRLHEAEEDYEGYVLTGTTGSVASGRIAYTLGLEGPAVTVDTACSSSLVALHMAAQALRSGECDLALAGGAAIMANPGMFVEFSRQRGLAEDGRCKAFADAADGTGWGEGVGMVLLERLSEAERNGHRVLAVIRGSAVNQDGASNGLTAPNGPSQQRVIRQALANAGLSAAEVDAVEAHGTGTKLGDPIEAQALLATYGQDRDPQQPLYLGSFKSNIGHTQAAAGVGGLIKMVMSMEHGVLPKTLHVDEPSRHVDWSAGAVELLSEERAWPETGRPRRAGVSSFGVSGTNAHLIVEQAPETPVTPVTEAPVAGAVPWLVSGKTPEALRAQAERLLAFAEAHPELSPVDIGHSLATGRAHLEHRAVVVAADTNGFQETLRALVDGEPTAGLVSNALGVPVGKPVLVFPGQGTQWVGMAASLLDESSVFAGRMGECAAALAPFVDFDLVQVIREAQDLDRVDVIQPVTWAVNVSLAEVWKSLGVVPGAVVGHSQGEIAAAAVAGALSLEDAARVVALRAQVIARVLAGLGGMASIPLPRTEVEARLADWPGRLDVAAVNGPNSTVISGDADAIVEFVAACQAEDIRARQVPVDYASHSAHVERIEAELLDVLAPITPRPAQIPFYSTVEGAVIDTAGVDAAYWYRNLRQTVRFDDVTRLLIADGYTTFVESSAHPVLTVGIQETADVIATGTLRRNEGTLARFLTSAAELHTQGAPIDWTAFFTPYQPKQVDLPTYAFQRKRFWLEDTAPEITASAEVSGGSDAVDARFWAAVEREDWQTLVGALDTDPDVPLGVVLPALAEWRRERRREATVDSWRYGLDWRPVSEPGTPAALSGTWLVVTPEGYVHDPSVATARAALVARGAQILSVVVSATDAERGLYAATLAEILETAEGQSPAGVLSFLALDERPHAAHPSMVSGVAATLALVQALGDVELDIPLWLATRGAVATGGTDRVTSPLQAQVWGLGRVVALEQPRRWGGLVDLPESLDERAQARLAAVLAGLDGEDQVAVRASGVLARRLVRTPGPAVDDSLAPGGTWRSRGTAVVTGGTGALGPLIARWLADSGTEHVVLTSRRGPAAPGMAELQTELADRGSRLTVAACDAADRDQIAALLAGLKADGETVRTVIHAAAFIELASLAESGLGEFADVLAAKVNGARYFDELLDDADLDAFVLFSSIAGVWGSGDHGAYAASNAYLDALAEQRRARGLKAASIAWGVWNVWDPDRLPDGVKPEQLQARGLPFIDPATAFVAMRQVIERDETFVAVADVDWDRFVPVFTSAGPRPLLTGVPEARQILEAAVRPAQQAGLPTAERAESPASPLAQRLAALATPAERDRALLDLVRAQAAAVLGHASADEIQPGRAFRELGFESLTSVELRNRLNTATGLRLPATLLFDHPTPSALAALLRDELLGSQAETTAPAAPAAAAAPPAADDDPIAIVAMSCRFPGGLHTPEQLWEVLTAGEETLSELPVNRGWDIDGIYDPDPEQHGKTYTRHGGFLHDADEFDPGFFGISPREALAMDPQQRILLETSWEAFERAGIDPQSLRGSRTAVFAGVSYHDYGSRLREAPEDVEGYLGTGNTASIASGRVSYILGLEGPAVTLDTGCSSSLVALHLAVQALRQGESDLALAGGVSVMAIPASFTEFSRQRGLSVDGRCRAFSADADGMGMSEGAGLVLLERLSDARRNGHRVLALVRGTATNQDGASNGLTAPNGPSQQRVIRQALASAGLSAAEVDAVEAHGTGTKLGDPIEAQALLATYGQDRDPQQPLFLGSVKSNIGHTQAASGAAGLIKMVLALQHGVLPKSLHIGEPTPQVDWEAGAVELLSEERVWPETGRPRRAGVSSFGISGTNAHTVIEQAPSVEEEPAPVTEAPVAGAVPWLVSARTETALRAQAERLLAFAEAHPELSPVDIGHSLATGRSAFEQRAAVIGHDRTELLDALRALTEDGGAPNLVRGTATEAGMTTFVFPGQGTQWVGMAASLLEESSVFAGRMGECAAALAPFVDFDLVQVIREAQDLDRVDVIQPVTWAVNVSLAEVWKSLGVVPGAVVGHSQGEIAAAAVAGALSLEDAARVVALRAQVIARVLAGLGGMASIPLPRTQVEARLADWTGRLDVAAVNGPNSTVISGDADAIVEFVAACQAEDIRARQVPVDYASHSAHVERIEAELLDVLAPITPRPAQIPFYSTVEGAVIDTAGVDAAYWYRNLRQTVRFDDVTRLLIADGYTTFIESSAHPVLTIGIQETADVIATGTLRRNEGTLARFLTSAAELHTQGAPIDWTAFFTPYQPKQADLPTYAFQRQRYWLEDTAGETTDVTAAGLVSAQHPLLGAAVPLADSDGFLLTGRLSLRTHPWLADHAVAGTVLLPGTGFVELAVRAADQAGCETVEELTLAAPLILPAHGAIDVQLNVSGADDSGRRSLSLYSRPESADAAEPWTRHATGVLAESAPTASPDGTTDGTPHADLGAWPPPGAEPIDIDGYYERLTTQGYGYGPSFQGLRAAWRGGDEVFDEVFAEVALPAEAADGADGFGIHPALLDAALHGLGLGLLPSAGEGRARLPFSWNGVTLHASGATALRVRITQLGEEDAVSITVADTTGRPVASVESLVVRQVVTDQLKVADPTVGQSLFRPDWVRIDTPGAQAAGSSWAVLGDDPLGLTGLGWHAYPDLASLAAAGAVPDVVFASFTAAPETASAEGAHGAVQRALELVRQWLADERLESSRLVLLTRRAVATGPGSPVGDVALTDAPVWGLLRSAQSEHPGRFLLIDVDGGTESLAALPAAVAAGEPQIAVRNGRPHALRLTRAELTNTEDAAAFGPDSTVLVTGASGTLGGLVARHLVERHGVRRLVLVSRRPADELARALRELGAEAVVAACDVADRRAVWDVLAAHTITAVVHTAGTIDDGVVESLTPERVAGVLRPKVDGALNLHELTAGSPLTAFVLFSSAAGVFGGPGQGGYAAANAFLDALAHDRRAQGLPAVSLGWGFWEERSGLTAHLDRTDLHRMNRLGVHPMTSQEGLALLDAAVATGQPHLLPMRLDVAALRRTAAGADVPALLRGLIRSRTRRTVQTAPGTSGPADAGSLRERLAGMTPPERTRTLEELVVTRVAAVLGHGSAEMIEPQRAFKELGFDSLTAVELRNRLRAATGLRLPATLVFDHPTPAAIAQHLAVKLLPDLSDGPGRPADTTPLPDATDVAALTADPGTGAQQALDSLDAMDLDQLVNLALDGTDGTDAAGTDA